MRAMSLKSLAGEEHCQDLVVQPVIVELVALRAAAVGAARRGRRPSRRGAPPPTSVDDEPIVRTAARSRSRVANRRWCAQELCDAARRLGGQPSATATGRAEGFDRLSWCRSRYAAKVAATVEVVSPRLAGRAVGAACWAASARGNSPAAPAIYGIWRGDGALGSRQAARQPTCCSRSPSSQQAAAEQPTVAHSAGLREPADDRRPAAGQQLAGKRGRPHDLS